MDKNIGQTSSFIEVLKIGAFRSLWLGQITSQIAINMLAFVLAMRVYETTHSNTAVSIIYLAVALPAVLFGMFAGVFVDRFDRKLILTLCNLSRAFAVLGFFFSSETLLWIIILVVIISIVTQFFVPAEAPTIPRIVPSNLLLTANSLFSFTFYGSVILGYLLSGPMLRLFGPHSIFLFISSLLFLSAIFVRQIPGKDGGEAIKALMDRIKAKGFWQRATTITSYQRKITLLFTDLFDAYRFIQSQKKVRGLIFLMVSSQALIAILMALAPGFADKGLKIDIADASTVMLGPAAFGMILGALWIGHFGKNRQGEKMIDFGVISAGFFLLLLSIVSGYYSLLLAVFFLFGIGMSNAFIDVPANTLLQHNTDEYLRGRIYGVISALNGGVAFIPVIIAGGFADLFGVTFVMGFIALVIFSYGILRWYFSGKTNMLEKTL
jgi:MFS family permease